MADFLEELNQEQLEAVLENKHPVLVLASVGSGKTRVVTYKIAYLIKYCGLSPYNILALTFTNKAAKEMQKRISSILEKTNINNLWIGTFHSICARILRSCYRPDFIIYDEEDSLNLVKDILTTMRNINIKVDTRVLLDIILKDKENFITPEEFKVDNSPIRALAKEVYKIYEDSLEVINTVDFSSLIIKTIKILQKDETILNKYQERFKYILVDEYQDINFAQFVLIKLLVGKNNGITVVGDDDQVIYSWRGASLGNSINSFEEEFEGAKVFKLTQNYRSTKNILEVANNLIKHNTRRYDKVLWTKREEGPEVVVYISSSSEGEARFVSCVIKELKKQKNMKYSDFAVFYRMHYQSRAIEEALLQKGIPYTIIGAVSFYKRKEIKDIIAYLKVLQNPADIVSLNRIINIPQRGIGRASLEKLKEYAKLHQVSFYDSLGEVENIESIKKETRLKILELVRLIDYLRLQKKNIFELVNEIIEVIDYKNYLKETSDYETRWQNIEEFLNICKEKKDYKLEDFLSEMSLYMNVDELSSDRDMVVLMTLHAAKGLEFPVVFIVGMQEGILPLVGRGVDLEEERRLCYVGITRAKERLYLSLSTADSKLSMSRFLEETGLLKRVLGEDDIDVGDMVFHWKFGRGKVLMKGTRDFIKVKFDSFGEINLSISHSQLIKPQFAS